MKYTKGFILNNVFLAPLLLTRRVFVCTKSDSRLMSAEGNIEPRDKRGDSGESSWERGRAVSEAETVPCCFISVENKLHSLYIFLGPSKSS